MEHEELTEPIIGCAMAVHRELGPGYLESVYRNALTVELDGAGLLVERERALTVLYRGVEVGRFVVDLIVESLVLVEIKVARTIAAAHERQLINYLTATGTDVGLLLNFGADRLEFRRKSRIYRPRGSSAVDGYR